MNKFLIMLKSQALQAIRAPRDKRLWNNYRNTINKMKSVEDSEFQEAFYEVVHSNDPNFAFIRENFIEGNFFPKQYEDMCQKSELLFTHNFQYEIRWWIACFQLCTEKLNHFIEIRKRYDTCILLGKYEEALDILDVVQQNFGVSFWFYESKIFVYSKLEKSVNDIIKQLPLGYNSSIIWYYTLKNRNTITHMEFKKIVLNELQDCDDYAFETYIKYKLLPFEYNLEPEDFLPLMHFSNNCALVDRYLVFLDLFEGTIVSDTLDKYKGTVRNYFHNLKEIRDDRLEAMCFCADNRQGRMQYQLDENLLTAKEYLLAGEINECRKTAIELLKKAPYCVQAMNIVAESDVVLQNQSDCFEDTLLKELLDILEAVYGMREGWKQCIGVLKKLMNCCSMSNWARSLVASVIRSYSSVETEGYIELKKREFFQYLDIETVCECLSDKDGLDYMSRLNSQNYYIKFKEALLAENYEKTYEFVKNKDIKCIVGIRDKRKSIDEKRAYWDKLSDKENTFGTRASKYYLAMFDLSAHFVEAMHYAVDLLISNIDKSSYIPWKSYIDRIEQSDSEIRKDICVPILYFVQYKYSPSETKDDIVLMCEDFLYFQGKKLPSLLNVYDECYPKNALVFFLRFVCVPDIISSALAPHITTSMELWKERIDICQILCNIDVVNEKVYEEEIRELTQKMKIYSELKIIEENRIHVNVEGMRPRLMEELEGDFVRYKLYLDKLWNEVLELLKQKKDEQFFSRRSDPDRVLQEMIKKIRDAFVSSAEYGLDFILSLSIRHGAIGDALRRPLANAGLITIFNEKDEEYEWNYELPKGMTNDEQETVKKAIIQLNADTDMIIDDLKTRYIQVRTEQGHESGIFNYCITQYEFGQMSYDACNMNELSEFVDYVFEYLWKKTESNMAAMRNLLRGEILNRYLAAFNAVKDTIDMLDHRNQMMSLRRKILDASNEMQNAIENVCFWFQRSIESKNQDFDLDFVFQMGYETICNMHPETRFSKVELEVFKTDGKKIEGKYLKAYSNIFYNLFDNIYKKATTNKGVKKIEYSLSQENNRQCIYLQNDYDCTGDISDDTRKLEKLQQMLDGEEYLAYVKGEGGTGIPKICNIIRKDLHRQGNIQCGLKEEENKFFIKIDI